MFKLVKPVVAGVFAASIAGSAMAGGLGDAIVEGEPFAVGEVAGAGSMGPLPLLILGAVAVAALVGSESASGTTVQD